MSVSGNYSNSRASQTSNEHDRADIKTLGNNLSSAEDKYKKALAGGDKNAIADAQLDFQDAQQNFTARMEMAQAIARLKDKIIEKIGQIGR